jgi:hypothetical protein
MEASSIYDNTYLAWKGMNCTASGEEDCWISAADAPMPQYLRWMAPEGYQAMVPTKLTITARDINAAHNTEHGPETMTLIGCVNGVDWVDIQTWSGLDFGANPVQTFVIDGSQAFVGIGIRVDNVRGTDSEFTQIGTFTVEGSAQDIEEMILEFNISSDNETLTLPVSAVADGFSPNYLVHWGDNSDWEQFTSDSPSHTYLTAGTYTVTLSGNVSSWGFRGNGDKNKLTKVLNFGKCEWKRINGSFNGCENLVGCVMGNTDTSACTDFRYMFRLANHLNILDVRGMD